MDKCIAVTGAGRGLGLQMVKRHLEEKDRVYAYDYHITDELRQLAAETPLLTIQECDIASTESVAIATKKLLAAEPKVDVLYNIAAIFRFEDKVGLPETDLDFAVEMYNINSIGTLRVCKALWGKLQKGSLVVNISSEAGSVGACRRSQEYGYCMSKAAVNMGAKIMSNALWETGARVVNFHPGWMRTAMGGERAMRSPNSVSPREAADHIADIVLRIDSIPRDVMYLQHTGEIMPW